MGFYYGWKPYVSAAERRRKAAKEVEKRRKQGQAIIPVTIEGRTIASTFWGKSWCKNLEQYSDYANRLPRGRTYVRNGSVVHLEIAPGSIEALVSGSALYKVKLKVAAVGTRLWKSICKDCAGSIDSLVELLQGRLSKAVMERICRQDQGLFPSPDEIDLSCSCPDGVWMCKHIAAVLYGVGARFDHAPELLFQLRGVDEKELIAGAGNAQAGKALPLGTATAARVLGDEDLSEMFGLDLAEPGNEVPVPSRVRVKAMSGKTVKQSGAKKSGPKKSAISKPVKKKRTTNGGSRG